jgi:hypothetical protein
MQSGCLLYKKLLFVRLTFLHFVVSRWCATVQEPESRSNFSALEIVWQAPILSCIDSCNVHQFLQRKPPKHLGVVPSLPVIPIYQFDFLCEFYFIIAFFKSPVPCSLPAFLFRRKGSIGQLSQHLLPSRAMSLRQQHLLPLPLSLPLPPTLPHPSQVLLRGRGLELRQADTPRLSSGR